MTSTVFTVHIIRRRRLIRPADAAADAALSRRRAPGGASAYLPRRRPNTPRVNTTYRADKQIHIGADRMTRRAFGDVFQALTSRRPVRFTRVDPPRRRDRGLRARPSAVSATAALAAGEVFAVVVRTVLRSKGTRAMLQTTRSR